LSVEDVLQHTYVEAILAIRKFVPRGEHAFGLWLRKLAEHHVIDAIRSLQADKRGGAAQRIAPNSPDASLAALLECLTGLPTQTTPSQGVLRRELHDALDRALARLPEHYRRVIQRYDLEGRPIDEVAAELERSPGAVHLIRVRAHARLRELLDGVSTIFSNSA
jgi:RNA polymerase sigma factor (sigma-70 family)